MEKEHDPCNDNDDVIIFGTHNSQKILCAFYVIDILTLQKKALSISKIKCLSKR